MNKRERAICREIYEQNKMRIYYFLLKQCKWLNEDAIHDVMQEVWKALSENIHEMCGWDESSCWAWLATVAHNQAVTYFRKATKSDALLEKLGNYDWGPKRSLSAEDIAVQRIIAENVLEKLTPKEKEVLFKNVLHPNTKDEKVKKGNAEVCKSYGARKKLEDYMKEGGL